MHKQCLINCISSTVFLGANVDVRVKAQSSRNTDISQDTPTTVPTAPTIVRTTPNSPSPVITTCETESELESDGGGYNARDP